ncbi:TPA: thiopurine S-methyltransferase [Legionella pneumophila]|uniref:Thiopurine S-methyltransferase n=1 Tax=Legionella pneumophila TaxID=446 RepID=A0A2S6EU80_LEGPN|nr:thiopurine S-methyltransferase [Legionella pneumophila]APF04529.1 thiopurine S-methyltransferase [Legionella pneumophila subsp. fraseri]AUB69967.1 thiopurine S-methyltransferase [Legionella pneumophila]AUB72942.1 thiopurine S-methyltransferase [Legionella pneumophila]KXB23078.1 thiopurine S-methyltransferase [Legionella pneumophila]KXB27249.1 thiopurine S-methyltransferase [Legionella pneumophila]
MNKGQYFWNELWCEGRISFHKEEVNPDLIAYVSSLNIPDKGRVLVPLCGKSLDMLWLVRQGYHVTGIELVEKAIFQFVQEHQITVQKETIGQAKLYLADNMNLWVSDIFALNSTLIEPVDAIYDRAALVALPKQLRSTYVDICLKWLKPEGSILLKTLQYNQEEVQGPPYSVSPEEVASSYQQCAIIELLKSQKRIQEPNDHLFKQGISEVNDYVWCIRKG